MLIYVPENNEDDWRTERAAMLDEIDKYIDRDVPRRDYKPGESRGFNIVATY